MNSYGSLEILIATHNPGKTLEVQRALQSLPLTLRSLNDFSVSIVDEVGITYEENAVLKALSYAKQTGLCALADDSGLEVDALQGKPGVLSARFGGEQSSDDARIRKLLWEISQLRTVDRKARFVCCMALAGWQQAEILDNKEPKILTIVEARCYGKIAERPLGTNGFGFDPVFIPAGYDSTFAELPIDVKARISHRAQALASIWEFLAGWLPQT